METGAKNIGYFWRVARIREIHNTDGYLKKKLTRSPYHNGVHATSNQVKNHLAKTYVLQPKICWGRLFFALSKSGDD